MGTVYFTETEPLVLLGHHECLEKFDMTFHGPERLLSLTPRCDGMVGARKA
jgi:hypothetical protein